jgi:hypothetical protein
VAGWGVRHRSATSTVADSPFLAPGAEALRAAQPMHQLLADEQPSSRKPLSDAPGSSRHGTLSLSLRARMDLQAVACKNHFTITARCRAHRCYMHIPRMCGQRLSAPAPHPAARIAGAGPTATHGAGHLRRGTRRCHAPSGLHACAIRMPQTQGPSSRAFRRLESSADGPTPEPRAQSRTAAVPTYPPHSAAVR